MAFTLTMPEIGETVTEGTVEKWLKQPGEHIAKYEPIVEVNTDKVNVELPSPVEGTVGAILAAEGEVVLIGAPLCTIEVAEGEVAEAVSVSPAKETAEVPAAEPAAVGDGRATPRVRRVASELGVDLARVTGTGPRGRILEKDVREFAAGEEPAAGADEIVPLTAVRRTIARRMTESAFSAPHAWLAMEADVTGLVALRSAQRAGFREKHGVDLTYLPFAGWAVAQTLKGHPHVNASWAEDSIILRKRVNLGIAVATERGLIVPVVPDADRRAIAELAKEMAALGERARENKLRLEDVQGGTFTLDNTGAFGSMISVPIINKGEAAIMSLEAVHRRPVAAGDDAIAVRSVVNICMSFDHRVLDGHQAGAFLGEVKERLEAFGPETET